MIKRFVPLAVLGISVVSLNACKNDSFQKTKDGLEYRIVKDAKGDKKPVEGDMVEMHINIRYKDDKTDTVLFNSRTMNANKPVEFPLMPPMFKGDWPTGIALLTPGDSAVFRVPVDSLKKNGQGMIPEFMKNGQKLTYEVVLVSVKSQAEVKAQQNEQAAQQSSIDDKKLQDYFAQNNIQPQKTASGLYYTISKEGTGPQIQAGQEVSVNYTGKTLDGNSFDSNVDPKFQHTEPLKFPVGQRQVIPGWDEGIMLLKKGSVAQLYIPSPLAYGAQSPGPGIEANSVLVFDVQVLDVK
jgi:FKBP-type peptidyl-prolyl cis-trans isomerase FkpA